MKRSFPIHPGASRPNRTHKPRPAQRITALQQASKNVPKPAQDIVRSLTED